MANVSTNQNVDPQGTWTKKSAWDRKRNKRKFNKDGGVSPGAFRGHRQTLETIYSKAVF